MADETRLKSSFELAMERLRQKDADAGVTARVLTDAEKAAIAEVRNFYEAKIAEQQVLHDSRMRQVADPSAQEALSAEWRADKERLVAERDLGSHVEFLGRRSKEELITLYQRCAIFVFPSTEESFGMPLVEAMACGAPIVASRSAATPEIAGDAALLCDAESPAALSHAILAVLDDATLRDDLQRRALTRARDFSWQDCARRTAAVLRAAAA